VDAVGGHRPRPAVAAEHIELQLPDLVEVFGGMGTVATMSPARLFPIEASGRGT